MPEALKAVSLIRRDLLLERRNRQAGTAHARKGTMRQRVYPPRKQSSESRPENPDSWKRQP